MKFKSLLILFFILLFGICVVSSVSATNPYNMTQHDEYLFECDCNNIDYDFAAEYFYNQSFEFRGCVGFIKDGILARSFDVYYDDSATIIIHVDDAKYKNVGIAGEFINQNECLDIINNVGNYSETMKILPFYTEEGINEAGVVCCVNIVPIGDKYDKVAFAKIESKKSFDTLMLPRFILDNFGSAKEAVSYIRDYCNVYNNLTVPLQILIADSSGDSYVLNFFDNKTWIVHDAFIMSNFYLYGVKFNEDGTVATPETNEGNVSEYANLTLHAMGLERYNIIVNDFNNLYIIDDFFTTLHKMKYSHISFPTTEPIMCSDLVGVVTIDASLSEFMELRDLYYQDYLNRQRGDFLNYQSVHQVVWDLNTFTFYIETQEKDGYKIFKLNRETTIDVYGLDELKVGKESQVKIEIKRDGKALANTQVCIDIFSDKNELLYSCMGYSNDEGVFTFTYTPTVAGKQSLVVTTLNASKTVDFEVSSNETSNQTVSTGTISMQATGNSLAIVLVLFILILSLGYLTYRKDNI